MEQFVIAEIATQTARFYGVPVDRLRESSRKKRIVRARWMAMYLSRSMTDATLEEIGFIFKRDHSSVVYAIRQIKASRRLLEFCKFIRGRIAGNEY